MNYLSLLFIFLVSGLLVSSCSKEEEFIDTTETETMVQTGTETETPIDFRDAFVGIYNCEKSNTIDFMFSTELIVEVSIDSLSDNGLIIGDLLVPIDSTGSFGPEFIGSENVTVQIDEGNMFLELFTMIENGIEAPCFIRGSL